MGPYCKWLLTVICMTFFIPCSTKTAAWTFGSCSTKEIKSFRFATTWRCVNNMNIFWSCDEQNKQLSFMLTHQEQRVLPTSSSTCPALTTHPPALQRAFSGVPSQSGWPTLCPWWSASTSEGEETLSRPDLWPRAGESSGSDRRRVRATHEPKPEETRSLKAVDAEEKEER